jgi:hypothetical protein
MIKKTFIIYCIFGMILLSFTSNSQTVTLESIINNGDPSKFINLVFLGDGYTESELDDFITHSEDIADYLFTISPFKEYQTYFNIYAIRVASADSGAEHPRTADDCPSEIEHPYLELDNYFGSTFDYYGIHRLLVATSFWSINDIISTHFPQSDINCMIVNTPFYGGSGGMTATGSIHSSANEIMVHEIGHTFGILADEYWAGDIYAGEYANMTQESDPDLIKWKNWLGFEGVGIYAHGTSGEAANWYRPHQSCKMRLLGVDFCAVCKEAFVLRILNLFGTPLKDKFPVETSIVFDTDSVMFTIDLYKPEPNTIKTEWLLNSETIALNTDTVYVHIDQLNNKQTGNLLNVQFRDTTHFIRTEISTYGTSWVLEKPSVVVNRDKIDNTVEAWPNPFADKISIMDTKKRSNLSYYVYNNAGQLIETGEFDKQIEFSTKSWDSGNYFINVSTEGLFEIIKLIKE